MHSLNFSFSICYQQIHLLQGNFKLSEQSLEVGLSYNFEVSLCHESITFLISSNNLYHFMRVHVAITFVAMFRFLGNTVLLLQI